MTDALFSTSTTAFLHDHALYSRADKIVRIAESDFALSRLKVCWTEGRYRNCSQCVKCQRMLLCFDALGILDKATSFDLDTYGRNRRRTFLIETENDYVRAGEVRELALRNGRGDIVAVVEESIRRSRRIESVMYRLRATGTRIRAAAYRWLSAGMIGA
jgi:hypothetical protein